MRAIDELLRDTHFAIRMLRKSPVFAVVIVAMLALGIGVNTAVFGVVNSILFRPLPVKDGARLQVIATYRAKTRALSPVSFPDLQDTGPRPPTCLTASRAIASVLWDLHTKAGRRRVSSSPGSLAVTSPCSESSRLSAG